MTLESLTLSLEKPKPRSFGKGQGYTARCPSCATQGHDKQGTHFSVYESDDGWWHVNCQKGCSESDILGALGLTTEDRNTGSYSTLASIPTNEIIYRYFDLDGKYLFEKVRTVKAGKKNFAQRIKLGDGEFNYKITEVLNGKSKTLYRLPQIVEAVATGCKVFICEGEKAVDRCVAENLEATCQPGGACANPATRWLPEHTAVFKGADVTIVADRDHVGEVYAKYVAEQLSFVAKRVRVVQSATIGEHDDAYDHFSVGKTADEFVPRPDLTPVRNGPRLASEIKVSKVDWLIYPYLAAGMLAGIDGDPGVGKSFIGAALASACSHGAKLPFSDEPLPKCNTLLYATEDSPEFVTVPRLIAFEAKLDCVGIMDEVFPLDAAGIQRMERDIREVDAKLVVIDPLTAFLSATKNAQGPAGANGDAHATMDALKSIAARTGACIICLRHLRKSSADGSAAIYAGIGGIEIVGKYRTSLQIRKHPDNPRISVVAHVKSNIGPLGESFGYEVRSQGRDVPPEFLWTGHVNIDAEELGNPSSGDSRRAYERAVDLLKEMLTGQRVPQDVVMAKAKTEKIGESTIRKAFKDLGVISTKAGFADHRYRWYIDPFGGDD